VKIYEGTNISNPPFHILTAPVDGGTGAYSIDSSLLPDGQYTAKSEQTDQSGNTGYSSPNTFTVDTTAPDITIDTHPKPKTTARSAKFTFHSSDGTATFTCTLDGVVTPSCTSPVSATHLKIGAHTFSVTATDAANNVSAPATFHWKVVRPR